MNCIYLFTLSSGAFHLTVSSRGLSAVVSKSLNRPFGLCASAACSRFSVPCRWAICVGVELELCEAWPAPTVSRWMRWAERTLCRDASEHVTAAQPVTSLAQVLWLGFRIETFLLQNWGRMGLFTKCLRKEAHRSCMYLLRTHCVSPSSLCPANTKNKPPSYMDRMYLP